MTLKATQSGQTLLGEQVAQLEACARRADAAKVERIRILEMWQKHSQKSDLTRRARLQRQVQKRKDTGFARLGAGASKALQRGSADVVEAQLKSVLQMNNNCA